MLRMVEADLLEWKTHPNRKPLLVRGARQVGKSFVIEKFGHDHFENLITVNFEFDPRYLSCFETIDPANIIRAIEARTQQTITPGKTLLFLDEIQDCPKAILALRYFKEKMPQLHVIGAGSLLEFTLNSPTYRKPVGRVSSLYMKPCTFKEYLLAAGDHRLVSYLSEVTVKTGIEQIYHELLLSRCREYFILGGMPEVVNYFVTQQRYQGCAEIHASILEYYQKDFAKYDHKINLRILQKVFSKAPTLIAKRFKFSDVDPDIQARDQRPILEALTNAGIIHPVYHTSASGLPLNATLTEKKFKLLFLDLGLAQYSNRIHIETLLTEELILMNQGALAEQFVGQELMGYSHNYEKPELYYWEREKTGSAAEVDYVLNFNATIFPIEVKAGATGRMRSIQVFLQEKHLELGVRISQHQFSLERNILSIPLYMISELSRLLKSL
jgi:predicted AAA+ superfamily ATPase